jgi:gp45
MIEIIIKKYLDGHLDVPSFFEHEAKMPASFVIIEKTGGKERNYSGSAIFAFQSYAPSMQKAAELNVKVKHAVKGLIELDSISGVHLNSDYNFTDTETKQYRYQAVFDINYY